MAIKILPGTSEVIIFHLLLSAAMASGRASIVAKILNEDCLTGLLDGADAQATQAFFEDYLCDDLDTGNYFAKAKHIVCVVT